MNESRSALLSLDYGMASEVGQHLFDRGLVNLGILAGGMGTRLGLDCPKTLVEIGGKTILNRILDRSGAYKKIAIMANESTYAAIAQAVLDKNNAFVFSQHQTRVFDSRGIESDTETSPAGHGDFFYAMHDFSCACICCNVQADYTVVCQGDNPLAPVDMVELVGEHHMLANDMTVVCVEKQYPEEPMGGVVAGKKPGTVSVIEYGEPESCDAKFGNIGFYVFSNRFLRKIKDSRVRLPFHLRKQPGGSFKQERFLFDLLAYTERSSAIGVNREKCFLPVKDKAGLLRAESAIVGLK